MKVSYTSNALIGALGFHNILLDNRHQPEPIRLYLQVQQLGYQSKQTFYFVHCLLILIVIKIKVRKTKISFLWHAWIVYRTHGIFWREVTSTDNSLLCPIFVWPIWLLRALVTLQVSGKCNTIILNNCAKVGVVFDSLISSAEVINSTSVELQVHAAPGLHNMR